MSGIQFPTGTHEVTTSGFSGTGPFLLAGVPAGTTERRTFLAAAGANAIVWYVGRDNAGNWERGVGRFVDTPSHQVDRLSVIASSNADALVNFPTGSIDVFVSVPMDLFGPGIISISAARTVNPWEHRRSFNVDASGGDVTVTAPALSDAGNGFQITVKKTDHSINKVFFATPGSETVEGRTSHELTTFGHVATYECDGSNWYLTRGLGLDVHVGDFKPTYRPTADPGWVMVDDGTIGNAASAATNRANKDTEALFTLVYDGVLDAWAPVSGGRGASAAADYAANKTIQLTRMLGRALTIAGAGNGLTARALGEYLGTETHTLTASEIPAHDHDQIRTGAGNTSTNVYTDALATTQMSPAFRTTGHLTSVGGDGAHNNMQPTGFLNAMIKL